MSFDLYFFRPAASVISDHAINAYLDAKIPVPPEQEPEQDAWHYGNMHTGVYFSLYRNGPSGVVGEDYVGFADTGISFSLNYMRPDFFGKEAFIFVQEMTATLGLYIIDPQGGVNYPVPANSTQLFAEWQRVNRAGCIEHFDASLITYIPPAVSDEIWAYNVTRPLLQQQLGNAYYVPQIMLFKQVATLEPVRLSAWLAPEASLFPEVDYVIVRRRTTNWLGKVKEETGIIAYGQLMLVLGDLLVRISGTDTRALLPQHAKDAAALMKRVQLDTSFGERMVLANMMYLFNYK
ncbi:hypothetical protein MKQ68_14895 [Chitinophaga horti]|uniref:Uncharacterized protein n=1 Tax=Chitinophaga horti TaxID=2920382 RepID=A0ABY6IZ74_9BACT|nr:hypothetical protein [Chitinophaga horti]UYQ91379.1 hypothetical protein MKQ68_14895 [Chitinophaga horti]